MVKVKLTASGREKVGGETLATGQLVVDEREVEWLQSGLKVSVYEAPHVNTYFFSPQDVISLER